MPRHHRVAFGRAPAVLSRREFFAASAAGAAAACGGGGSTPASPSTTVTGRLSARPQAQRTTLSPGAHQLGRDAGRDDGIIYVPHGFDPDEAQPFAVMMHGGGGTSITMEFTLPLAEECGVVLLLPNSRTFIWDAVVGPFGPDATFLDDALAQVFSSCAIDPARVTLGGLSDGATYALALGLLNGDLFTRLVAFSPGFLKTVDRHGKPRVFISHGTRDTVLNINLGGRGIARQLTDEGYDVTYREFDGGHEVPAAIAREAFAWLS
jgi:poly(3-hydroxybutyrate) depolymerase